MSSEAGNKASSKARDTLKVLTPPTPSLVCTYALQMQQGKIACAASKMQQVHLLGNATSESALWIGHFETKMVA
jgi:hypothetical protein